MAVQLPAAQLPPDAGLALLFAGIGIGVAGLTKAAALVQQIRGKGEPADLASGDWRAHITQAVTSLAGAVASLGQQLSDGRRERALILERLGRVPTREDLLEGRKEDRHEMRNLLTGINADLEQLHRELLVTTTRRG